jgi:hypothetical protein
MLVVALHDPDVEAESARMVEASRKQILASKLAREGAAFLAQKAVLRRLEDAAIAWTDSDKPDIRTVLVELYLLRAFRAMLRTLPKSRKKKPRARRNLGRRRPRNRRPRS